MVNKILNERFICFELSKTKANNTNFLINKPVSQYNSRLDWSRDEFCQSLFENPGPKPVLFVSKAIINNYCSSVSTAKQAYIFVFRNFY